MAVLSPAAEELKTLIVEAGLELLDDSRMHFDLETVSYANVFRELRETEGVTITGSSVHGRIWASQEHFRLDVVAELYRQDPTHTREALDQLLSIFDEIPEGLEPEERTREFFRRFGNHCVNRAGLWRWVQVVLLFAATSTTVECETAQQFRALNEHQTDVEQAMWSARFQEIFHRLDLAPRKEIDETMPDIVAVFTSMVARVMTGYVLDSESSGSLLRDPIMLHSPLSDKGMPWTSIGIVLHGCALGLFEQTQSDGRPQVSKPKYEDMFTSNSGPETPDSASNGKLPEASNGKQRRSRQELRALLIRTGVDLIRKKGIQLAPSSLTYRAVFDQIKETQGFTVNRSSVHKRFWDNHDAFRLEVLAESADRLEFLTQTDDALLSRPPTIVDADGNLDRLRSVKAFLQALGRRRLETEKQSGVAYRALTLKCAVIGFPQDSAAQANDLVDRLGRARQRHLNSIQKLIQDLIAYYRLGATNDFDLDVGAAARFLAAISAMAVSGTDLQRVWGIRDPDSVSISIADSSGTIEDWDLQSYILCCSAAQFFDLDQ